MYQDIISFFPHQLDTLEFAGLLGNQSPNSMQNIDDALFIANINDVFSMLFKFLKIENIRFSLMITCLEHTTCFLFDCTGWIWCFDPLKASLVRLQSESFFSLPTNLCGMKIAEETEYAGLLLLPGGYKNKLLHLLKE